MELEALNHPTWLNSDELYKNHYSITNNYCLHLFLKRRFYIPGSISELDGFDCTIGDALRLVMYDKYDLRSNKTSNGYKDQHP